LLTAAYAQAQRGDSAAAVALADDAAEVAARFPARWPANSLFTAGQVPIYHNALGGQSAGGRARRAAGCAADRGTVKQVRPGGR
jgi:hypothetical protein